MKATIRHHSEMLPCGACLINKTFKAGRELREGSGWTPSNARILGKGRWLLLRKKADLEALRADAPNSQGHGNECTPAAPSSKSA